MDVHRFREIATQFIQPLFTGSELEEEVAPKSSRKLVAYLDQSSIAMRPTTNAPFRLRLTRSQPFTRADSEVVLSFIVVLRTLKALWGKTFLPDLIQSSMHRVIARALTGGNRTDKETRQTLAEVLSQFDVWADQTYEGSRISAAVGLDPDVTDASDVNISEVYRQVFGAVLSGGLETFLTLNCTGHVHSYEPMPSFSAGSEHIYAPLRFTRIADWSTGNRIGVGLNKDGEILVAKNKELVFCKRRGSWHHFTHDAVIKRLSLDKAIPNEVCSAIYETALDSSFTRTGGCIAVVRRTQSDDFRSSQMVADKDFLASSSEIKSRYLQRIIQRPFQQLDRRLRAEIVAIDGATILSYKGEVLAAGAIVKVPAGSTGGGRLAATRALAQFGLGIKVSTDGAIRVYAKRGENVIEAASVG